LSILREQRKCDITPFHFSDRAQRFLKLMLLTHEIKTTHKFSGRKGVEDEVLEFPLIIMQSNIGNERFSHHGPKAQAPMETTET